MRRAATLAALLGALVMHGNVHANPSDRLGLQPHQELMVDMYVRTRMCMRSAGIAARQRGGDAAHTQYFMASVCSTAFLSFLRRDMPESEAQEIIARMVQATYLEDVLNRK